jgi:hypothetical protein
MAGPGTANVNNGSNSVTYNPSLAKSLQKNGVKGTDPQSVKSDTKINSFGPNEFKFSEAQQEDNLRSIMGYINKNASSLNKENPMENLVISAGCDPRPASAELKKLDEAVASRNMTAIKAGLDNLGVTSDDDFETFCALANQSQPGENLNGNYSLHILRSMTVLETTKAAINKCNLTDAQKAQAIKDIKVEVVCGGVTTRPSGVLDDRFNQITIAPKNEWALGKDETVEFLIDNSPSGKEEISKQVAFLLKYVDINKDNITGKAKIRVTRFAGDNNGFDKKLGRKADQEENYKTFLTIDANNIKTLDLEKAMKDGIDGMGSGQERMLMNSIVKLQQDRDIGERPTKIFTVSDEGFQTDLTRENLSKIQTLKQDAGINEVNFVIVNKQGVPNKVEAGELLKDLDNTGITNDLPKELESLFSQSKYSGLKGDEILNSPITRGIQSGSKVHLSQYQRKTPDKKHLSG